MKPRSVRFAPPIPTAAARNLEVSITRLTRRRPDIGTTVEAIRAGDNDALLRLVHEARGGNEEAAAVAIWTLLPRLCAVIRSRLAPPDWRTATDEYLGLAYLTIHSVRAMEPADFLADKLVARVRRRYERAIEADRRFSKHLALDPCGDDDGPHSNATPVEEHTLIRLELQALREAHRDHAAVRADLQTVMAAMQQAAPKRGPQRMAVLRSRRRLLDHLNEAA